MNISNYFQSLENCCKENGVRRSFEYCVRWNHLEWINVGWSWRSWIDFYGWASKVIFSLFSSNSIHLRNDFLIKQYIYSFNRLLIISDKICAVRRQCSNPMTKRKRSHRSIYRATLRLLLMLVLLIFVMRWSISMSNRNRFKEVNKSNQNK